MATANEGQAEERTMIQDITPHKFHNEFHLKKPGTKDILLVFNDKKEVLVRESDEENIDFPKCGEAMNLTLQTSFSPQRMECVDSSGGTQESQTEPPFISQRMEYVDSSSEIQEQQMRVSFSMRCMEYAFSLDDIDYYLLLDFSGSVTLPGCEYLSLAQVRAGTRDSNRPASLLIMTGWHLYVWYRSNQFCGRCGQRTVRDTRERMLRCPHCGNMIYPRINPAVIVAVTDGDRILLSRYAGRLHTGYALIACFVEIGETLEETVAR
ncbi:MAG: hypothetical protein LUC90_09660, partial [Lachnospiraceae bacterium]|nr:hypothetical protein [Lachnospiraceae bacterium]